MQTIELNTQIENNELIHLPEMYKNWFGKSAKLILLESTEPEAMQKISFADNSESNSSQAKTAALRSWINTLPEVPFVPLSALDREELYR